MYTQHILLFRRIMAAAASATFGRFGSLFANILFGQLIDSHCILLIIIFSSLLISKYNAASRFLPYHCEKRTTLVLVPAKFYFKNQLDFTKKCSPILYTTRTTSVPFIPLYTLIAKNIHNDITTSTFSFRVAVVSTSERQQQKSRLTVGKHRAYIHIII